MLQRYNDFAAHGVRDIKGFNKLMEEKGDEKGKMPQIVIIIDELADLMMAAPARWRMLSAVWRRWRVRQGCT